MTKVVDGRSLAWRHEQRLIEKIKQLKVIPKVVSILVGEDPASVLYCNIKQNKAYEVGINFEMKKFPADISWDIVAREIERLNNDQTVSGIMIQFPFPAEFLNGRDEDEMVQKIAAHKDIDGLTGKGPVLHATVKAVISILKSENIDIKSKVVAVVGATGMVGKPMVAVLQKMGAKVVQIDSKTEDLQHLIKEADIVISCVGKANLITKNCIKEGTVVIDVGMDVDFEQVAPKCLVITPPKGGVGPMTVISLMENAVELTQKYS